MIFLCSEMNFVHYNLQPLVNWFAFANLISRQTKFSSFQVGFLFSFRLHHVNKTCEFSSPVEIRKWTGRMSIVDIYLYYCCMAKYLCSVWWMWFWFMSCKYTTHWPNGFKLQIHKLIKKPLVCCYATAVDVLTKSTQAHTQTHIKISILLIWPHFVGSTNTPPYGFCVYSFLSLCTLFIIKLTSILNSPWITMPKTFLLHFTQFAIIYAAGVFKWNIGLLPSV